MPIRRNAQVIGPDVQQTPMGFGNALLEGVQLYKQQQQARANALLNMRRQDEIERAKRAEEIRQATLDRESQSQRAIENERAAGYLGMQQTNTDINRQRFDRDLRNEDRLEVDRRRALEAQAQAAAESDRPDVARRLMEEAGASPGNSVERILPDGSTERVGPLKFTREGQVISLDPNEARNARAPRANALFTAESNDPRIQSVYKDTRDLFTETGDADKAAVFLERRLGDIASSDDRALAREAAMQRARTLASLRKAMERPTESQSKYALLGGQMSGEIDEIRGGPALSEEDLGQLQTNEARAATADSLSRSVIGAPLAAAGRAVGFFPKSKYDGLTPEKQKVANAWDNSTEKYARVLTGAGMPAEEATRMATTVSVRAGDWPEMQDYKLRRQEAFRDQVLSLSGNAQAMMGAARNWNAQNAAPASPSRPSRPVNPVANARAADNDQNRARAQRATGNLSEDDFISQHGGK